MDRNCFMQRKRRKAETERRRIKITPLIAPREQQAEDDHETSEEKIAADVVGWIVAGLFWFIVLGVIVGASYYLHSIELAK